jgi:hypothetical protein
LKRPDQIKGRKRQEPQPPGPHNCEPDRSSLPRIASPGSIPILENQDPKRFATDNSRLNRVSCDLDHEG